MSPTSLRPHMCGRNRTGWVAAAALGLSLAAGTAIAQVPTPTVTGPIASTDIPGAPTHNYIFFASDHPLAQDGYTEQEYFFSGTANRYNTPVLATGSVIASGVPYKTRMVVREPADKRQFNGTVIVEWLNVTNGFDADNLWFFDWEHILAEGYAWVGVSAQLVGVNELKQWNPNRYGSLDVTNGGTVTDDSLSYDIFSQAAQAIRNPGFVNVLNGLKPKRIIGAGESQSAFRLSYYINDVNPLGNVYDGFLLLSTFGQQIRPDLSQPVFKVLTEFDVVNSEAAVRQPNTSMYRSWEIAGTSHVDVHLRKSREPLELRDNPLFTNPVSSAEAMLAPQCAVPQLGTLPPTGDVVNAAFDDLVQWISNGTKPPIAPYLDFTQINPSPAQSVIARNSLGLAIGGIQLPEVSVPTYLNVGTNSGPGACVRWGYHLPFSVAELNEIYSGYDNYVNQVAKAANADVKKGFIEPQDARQIIYQAIESGVGNPTQAQKDKALAAFFTAEAGQ
ncbi:MAG: hypothetical protein JO264_03090 [Acidisphaera sp.]|nr:hypothetical protein [Acidisphaera sp.]